MDITPQDNTTQSISDDQELAKALAGVLPDEPEATAPATPQETITTTAATVPIIDTPAPAAIPVPDFSLQSDTSPVALNTSLSTPELESIKNQALGELRPLIDRVELPAEEKFDAYLMLLRSTDDSTLIAPAHGAAQNISDEKRKAEALLEIIKEIDYLSRKDSSNA